MLNIILDECVFFSFEWLCNNTDGILIALDLENDDSGGRYLYLYIENQITSFECTMRYVM